ncbi:MAG: hypothetical protein IAE82_16020 [Opitutaceae bacterium]|nr:hypothetical protein [Opitutaceae bacterium]
MPAPSSSILPHLEVRLGPVETTGTGVACPVLAGEQAESLFPRAQAAGCSGGFAFYQSGDWLLGHAAVPIAADLEEATRRLYLGLLRALGGHLLARVWNYVPAINAQSAAGLENYRAFCRGRSLAFEEQFGAAFPRHAPAASAVGCEDDRLSLVFAAHAGAASHVENPRQLPAYAYPPEHGPRAPTFARATRVDLGTRRRAVFISGTAAIRGHASVAPGRTLPQLECTLENLREISVACGLGPDLAAGCAEERFFKVYLRHAEDLAAVRARLEDALIRAGDRVTYLRADICRAELNVEIEATLPAVALE